MQKNISLGIVKNYIMYVRMYVLGWPSITSGRQSKGYHVVQSNLLFI